MPTDDELNDIARDLATAGPSLLVWLEKVRELFPDESTRLTREYLFQVVDLRYAKGEMPAEEAASYFARIGYSPEEASALRQSAEEMKKQLGFN